MKFQTHYRNNVQASRGEKVYGKSMTRPDQADTPKQILEKFRRGIPLNARIMDYYEDQDGTMPFEDHLPDLERLDIAERVEILRAAQDAVHSIRKKQDEEKAKQRQKKYSELVKAEAERLLKEKTKTAGDKPAEGTNNS